MAAPHAQLKEETETDVADGGLACERNALTTLAVSETPFPAAPPSSCKLFWSALPLCRPWRTRLLLIDRVSGEAPSVLGGTLTLAMFAACIAYVRTMVHEALLAPFQKDSEILWTTMSGPIEAGPLFPVEVECIHPRACSLLHMYSGGSARSRECAAAVRSATTKEGSALCARIGYAAKHTAPLCYSDMPFDGLYLFMADVAAATTNVSMAAAVANGSAVAVSSTDTPTKNGTSMGGAIANVTANATVAYVAGIVSTSALPSLMRFTTPLHPGRSQLAYVHTTNLTYGTKAFGYERHEWFATLLSPTIESALLETALAVPMSPECTPPADLSAATLVSLGSSWTDILVSGPAWLAQCTSSPPASSECAVHTDGSHHTVHCVHRSSRASCASSISTASAAAPCPSFSNWAVSASSSSYC